MTPRIVEHLSPSRQRALAVGLLVLAIVAALAVVLGPVVLLHRHYDRAIADTSSRLRVYERVAAQAPALRVALNAMQQQLVRRVYQGQ